MRPTSCLPNCVERLHLGSAPFSASRKTPKSLAQLNTLLPETVPFLILTKVLRGLASPLGEGRGAGRGAPCSSEDCISQYSSRSLSQGASDPSGVTAKLQGGWALSGFTGEKAEAQPGEVFLAQGHPWSPDASLGRRSFGSKFSVLSSPPFPSKHRHVQPACYLPQFPFLQK